MAELTMEVEVLLMERERQEPPSFDRTEVVDMSRAVSTIGKPFGLQRVCQALDFPRATIYAERARALSNVAQLCSHATRFEAQGVGLPAARGDPYRSGSDAVRR
ncbi:MAG: hypothetical protein VB135_02200 [Burkholderia sp.]